jgi:hypothetical protein
VQLIIIPLSSAAPAWNIVLQSERLQLVTLISDDGLFRKSAAPKQLPLLTRHLIKTHRLNNTGQSVYDVAITETAPPDAPFADERTSVNREISTRRTCPLALAKNKRAAPELPVLIILLNWHEYKRT